VSPEEAASLDAATTDEARAKVLDSIRARHAAERLREAVAAQTVSAEEAERLVDEVRQGGHTSSLRRRINQLAGAQAPRDDLTP